MEILLSVFALLFFLTLSGFFSGMETGVLSSSSLKVKNASAKGDGSASILEKLLHRKLNTIIYIIVGTNIANTCYTLIGENLFRMGLPARTESANFAVVTLTLTPVLVIFGEIFPKALFKSYSYSLTRVSARLLQFFERVLTPLSFPFYFLSQIAIGKKITQLEYTKETLNLLVESGAETGKVHYRQEKLNPQWTRSLVFKKIQSRDVNGPFFSAEDGEITGTFNLAGLRAMPPKTGWGVYADPVCILKPEDNCGLAIKKLTEAGIEIAVAASGNRWGYVTLESLLSIDLD